MVTIYQIALFVWFPLYMVFRTGKVRTSISAYSYDLEGNEELIFILWLVGLGASMWFQIPALGPFAYIMGMGFCISGMSPDHRRDPNSVEDTAHMVGTVIAVMAGVVGLVVEQGEWLHIAVGVPLAIPILFTKRHIFYLEFLAFAMIVWRLLQI